MGSVECAVSVMPLGPFIGVSGLSSLLVGGGIVSGVHGTRKFWMEPTVLGSFGLVD